MCDVTFLAFLLYLEFFMQGLEMALSDCPIMDLCFKIWKLLLSNFSSSSPSCWRSFNLKCLKGGCRRHRQDDGGSDDDDNDSYDDDFNDSGWSFRMHYSQNCTQSRQRCCTRRHTLLHTDARTHARTRSHTNTLALPLQHTHLLHLMPSNNTHALAADSRRHYQTCSTQKMWISETILKRQQTCSRRL